ncbi:MAG: hypothetical protein HOJ48_10650 [Desulfobacula sp.]|nr:hypothetical protein [Desulfobacula sp.]MBT6339741.1 hypothetical protein [Desulfobacula sp.]
MTEEKVKSKTPRPKKVKDFDKMAMVEPALSIDIFQPKVFGDNENQDGLTMDSTSITEISIVHNHEYSNQILARAKKAFNPTKLEKLKEKKPGKYLEEAKDQVEELCSCIEALITHTALFTVSLLIAIGLTLDDVEAYFGKKSKYMKWLRENFGHSHLRYFQHAKQLAKMGEFARKYAALGKNRLLEFARIKTKLETDEGDLLTEHPFQDITEDIDGVLFSEHVDSIITYYRMIEAGIDFIIFEQASLIAAMLHKSIAVKMAKGIKIWLDKFESPEKKQEAFNHFLLNKLAFPYETKEEGPINETKASLNRVMGKILDFYERVDIEDEVWVLSYKDRVDKSMLIKIHGAIVNLAEKFTINLEEDNQNNNDKDENKGEKND